MNIRHGRIEEMDKIREIFHIARQHMRDEGNSNQWINGYPQDELIMEDISNGDFYVVEEDGEIVAVFSYIKGEDETYLNIENGQWLNDNYYGTVHRIGSNGKCKGIMAMVKGFCLDQVGTLRIDTHKDNKTMKAVLQKEGFTYCGVIYVADGSPRDAYQIDR